jgi:hypothetical protein
VDKLDLAVLLQRREIQATLLALLGVVLAYNVLQTLGLVLVLVLQQLK